MPSADVAQSAPTVKRLVDFLERRTGRVIEGRTLHDYGLVVQELIQRQVRRRLPDGGVLRAGALRDGEQRRPRRRRRGLPAGRPARAARVPRIGPRVPRRADRADGLADPVGGRHRPRHARRPGLPHLRREQHPPLGPVHPPGRAAADPPHRGLPVHRERRAPGRGRRRQRLVVPAQRGAARTTTPGSWSSSRTRTCSRRRGSSASRRGSRTNRWSRRKALDVADPPRDRARARAVRGADDADRGRAQGAGRRRHAR